jgi:hypothetical protein
VKFISNYNINGSAGDWKTITFDTPFDYNGMDNIIVQISWTGCSYYSANNWAYNTPGEYHILWDSNVTGIYRYEFGTRVQLEITDTAIETTSIGSIKNLFNN